MRETAAASVSSRLISVGAVDRASSFVESSLSGLSGLSQCESPGWLDARSSHTEESNVPCLRNERQKEGGERWRGGKIEVREKQARRATRASFFLSLSHSLEIDIQKIKMENFSSFDAAVAVAARQEALLRAAASDSETSGNEDEEGERGGESSSCSSSGEEKGDDDDDDDDDRGRRKPETASTSERGRRIGERKKKEKKKSKSKRKREKKGDREEEEEEEAPFEVEVEAEVSASTLSSSAKGPPPPPAPGPPRPSVPLLPPGPFEVHHRAGSRRSHRRCHHLG